ncbi:ProQ/FINO family protein [Erwinia sp. S38]|uniref:ProQ/FINO family protein n=1 Tax=Erwinia sp. S38 TaxID=2769338 RepID=UPI001F15DF8A|nr:ProQ/FinO family protein [Erwinia sp. S38]
MAAEASGGPETAPRGHQLTPTAKRNRRRIDNLIKHFPDVLSRKEPVPLKVGILDDMVDSLQARGATMGTGQVKAALTGYTSARRYLRAIAAGGPRYGIDGQPCGEVAPEHQQIAADAIEQQNARPVLEPG